MVLQASVMATVGSRETMTHGQDEELVGFECHLD